MQFNHAVSARASRALTQRLAASEQPRTWVRRIIGGGQTVEACPVWCTADHRADASGNLDDLAHLGHEMSAEIPIVHHWEDGEPVTVRVPALSVQIRQDPYSDNPRRSRPFAVVEVADDYMADELDPDDLADIIAQVRTQLDRMEHVHAQLVQARAAHH